jgi:hypothetical protein
VNKKKKQCKCKNGYVGNNKVRWEIDNIVEKNKCKVDDECERKMDWLRGKCRKKWIEKKNCDVNDDWNVVEKLKIRKM